MPSQTVSVNASAHDGEDTSHNGSQLDFDEGAVGCIFVLTSAIPAGSTITAATIDFVTRASDAGTNTVLDIYLEPTTSPDDFDGGATDVSSRSRTTASAEWTPADQADEATWTTTDFSAVVQERLNAESGFSISDELCVLFISDTYQTVTRGAYSYDDTPAKAASLTLEWTEGTIETAAAADHGDSYHAANATLYYIVNALATAWGDAWAAASAAAFVEVTAQARSHGNAWHAAQDAVPARTAYARSHGDGWHVAAEATAVTIKPVTARSHGDGWHAAYALWMNSVLSTSRLSASVPLAVGAPADDLAASVPFAVGALDTGL